MTGETSDEQPEDARENDERDDNRWSADERDESPPLSDLAGRVAERRASSGGDTADTDELFESVRVSELDSEDVWTSLVEDDADADDDVGVGGEAEPVGVADGVSDHVVPKAEFCQRCEHFDAPPSLGCSHEGTAIVEVVDTEHFRVRNCPMVEDDD